MTPAGAPAECVVNISEGRDSTVIAMVAAAGGACLLDVHSDPEHHRSVLTLAGPLDDVEVAARQVARAAVSAIDLTTHRGVHPRLVAVDVVPFVPLPGLDGTGIEWSSAVAARDAFADWAATELALPSFLYGTGRTLPQIRREAFTSLAPDAGGARPVLIAYNVWISVPGRTDAGTGPSTLGVARTLAAELRRPGLRTLGLPVGDGAQVSCNVVDPGRVALTEVYDAVAVGAALHGMEVDRGELVGLLPTTALAAVPRGRWSELGLRAEDTIESRLATRTG